MSSSRSFSEGQPIRRQSSASCDDNSKRVSRPLKQIQKSQSSFSSSSDKTLTKLKASKQGPINNKCSNVNNNANKENCPFQNEMEYSHLSSHEMEKEWSFGKMVYLNSHSNRVKEKQHRQEEHYDEEIIRILSCCSGDIRDPSQQDRPRTNEELSDISVSGRCCIPFHSSNVQPSSSSPSLHGFSSVLHGDLRLLHRPRPCFSQEIIDDLAHVRKQQSLSIISSPGKRKLSSENDLQSKGCSAFHKVQRL
mmetsp:Transcript_12556/g.23560  ORF Transcript_12556/g.23560 Transcript_12556/m.23560 type:complete len:250 (-) Transcript_12556:80-829(-)